MKVIFEVAFLRGELEIEDDREEYIIPIIYDFKFNKKGMCAIDASHSITFYKTDEVVDDMPLFKAKGDEIRNLNFKE